MGAAVFYMKITTGLFISLLHMNLRVDGAQASEIGRSDEYRLVADLLRRYGSQRLSRPVSNSTQAVNVTFGLAITQVVELSETEGTLTMQVWKHLKWYDDYLSFSQEEYGGLESVALSADEIWVPDITLYNRVSAKNPEEKRGVMAIVFSSGLVYWIPPLIYTSSCQIDASNFPFDTQLCHLKFGSWAYTTTQLDLHIMQEEYYDKGVSLAEYQISSGWNITNVTTDIRKRSYTCCPGLYTDVVISLALKRSAGCYSSVLLLPSLVLSCLLLALYWVPPQRPDRTTLGMAICSSFFVLLLVIVSKVPPTSNTKLGTFCGFNLTAAAVAVAISIFVVNVSITKRRMPPVLRKIFVVWLNPLCVCARERATGKTGLPVARTNGEEWLILASVLNRILFVVHLAFLIFAIVYTLPWIGRM